MAIHNYSYTASVKNSLWFNVSVHAPSDSEHQSSTELLLMPVEGNIALLSFCPLFILMAIPPLTCWY